MLDSLYSSSSLFEMFHSFTAGNGAGVCQPCSVGTLSEYTTNS